MAEQEQRPTKITAGELVKRWPELGPMVEAGKVVIVDEGYHIPIRSIELFEGKFNIRWHRDKFWVNRVESDYELTIHYLDTPQQPAPTGATEADHE